VCSSEIQFDWETQDVPYFGEAMLIAGVCSCGFRHSDTILLCQKEPARYSLEVTDLEDLNARVIRSSSGTIRVLELGVDIEPGPASDLHISNVEGPGQNQGMWTLPRDQRERRKALRLQKGEAIPA
jgi:zinc finger protein